MNILIGVVTVVLYAVAWPTLHLTHQVSYPMQPIIAALAAWPFILVRANPALGWAVSAVSALVIPWVFDLVPDSGYVYPWQVVHIIVIMTLLLAVSLVAGRPPSWWRGSPRCCCSSRRSGRRRHRLGGRVSALVVFGLLVRWLVLSADSSPRKGGR